MTRPDANQSAIVDALRQAGVWVEIIGQPVDLLTWYRGKWLPLEVKPLKKTHSKLQKRQSDFIDVTGCLVVKTVQQALNAVLYFNVYDGCLKHGDTVRDRQGKLWIAHPFPSEILESQHEDFYKSLNRAKQESDNR